MSNGPDESGEVPQFVVTRLRAGREQNGLSVRALARTVNVSPSFISQIENGKANPSVGTLLAIVSALGISLDELFSGVPDSGQADGAGRGLTCDNFLTTEEFLPLHRDHLERTERLLADAEAGGNQRLVEMNTPVKLNLARIIEGLGGPATARAGGSRCRLTEPRSPPPRAASGSRPRPALNRPCASSTSRAERSPSRPSPARPASPANGSTSSTNSAMKSNGCATAV